MNVLERIGRWSQDGTRKLWFEYGGLALLILLPLLSAGYILTLDLVFTPSYAWPGEVTNTYPLQVLLWVLYHVLPGDVIEKLVLYGILLCAGVGMHLLLRVAMERVRVEAWDAAAYFAGIFYMINPFIYARFMAGQWMVLLGYALVPFFVRAFLLLLHRPSWRAGAVVGIWAFIITTVSLHHVGIIGMLGFIMLTVSIAHYRKRRGEIIRRIKASLTTVALWGILSSFWLFPTLVGNTSISRAVEGFDSMHFNAFSTYGSNLLGALGNVLRLQGFWAETQQLFLLPQQIVPAWGLIFALLWVLVGIGIRFAWRKSRVVASIGIASIIAGIVIAATPVVSWIGSLFPIVNGYREPHKFVNLIALGYSLFGGFGVLYLRERYRLRDRMRMVVVGSALLVPIVITPVMFGGFAGQLKPHEYPSGWHQANLYVKERIGGSHALFLPWHQYARYSFSGRTIANPAAKYFAFPTIISDDPEFKEVPPTLKNAETAHIQTLLANEPERLAQYLKKHDVRYVLLAKEQEYQRYQFLSSDTYTIRLTTDTITVYEVKYE
ncbi:hypothetical protein PV379_03720 [Streptomyces caniscabiei]|uniref:hypothetical protein n=1 Tax=Streptomyces caniscabiei TaxID=2746961 RepID=UPI0029B3DC8F|nr:hypothetical protein [Streptomyces caniscabiei]MDX2776448.1 hypothetical protein [Streptomyces caniscabiei]